MGYDYPDLVWTPRVGSTGDDRYHIPGATKLDGTVDSGAQTRAKASQVDDVIDEVNARNQEWYDAGLGGTSAQLAHLPTGKIKLSAVGTVRTAISRCRAVPRASSRLAMFRHAISSRKTTAPSSTHSARLVPARAPRMLAGFTTNPMPVSSFG